MFTILLAAVFRLQLAEFLRELLDIMTWVHDVWIDIRHRIAVFRLAVLVFLRMGN